MEKINIMEILKGAKEGDVFMNLLGTKFVFRDGNLITEGGYFDEMKITDIYKLKDIASMMFYKVLETNSYSEEDLPYGIPKKITFKSGAEKVYFRIKMKDGGFEMKNHYVIPTMKIVETSTEDVMTTSPIKTLNEIFYAGSDRDVADRVEW